MDMCVCQYVLGLAGMDMYLPITCPGWPYLSDIRICMERRGRTNGLLTISNQPAIVVPLPVLSQKTCFDQSAKQNTKICVHSIKPVAGTEIQWSGLVKVPKKIV